MKNLTEEQHTMFARAFLLDQAAQVAIASLPTDIDPTEEDGYEIAEIVKSLEVSVSLDGDW